MYSDFSTVETDCTISWLRKLSVCVNENGMTAQFKMLNYASSGGI